MKNIIENGKDFKIIPSNYQSATLLEVKKVKDDSFEAELSYISENELNDYEQKGEVEVFGSSEEGLVYFTTEILEKNGKILTIKIPQKHKSIQRREYSRVDFNGKVKLNDFKDIEVISKDISAGGIRILVDKPLEIGKEYASTIVLTNNMTINTTIQPIRVSEVDVKPSPKKELYMVSGRFKNIESIDRIALVQYSFKALMEAENKK